MTRRDILTALAWSLALGLVVGLGFAAYDWQLNPGGIFRGPEGTNWTFVFETAYSWFMPIVLTTFLPLLCITWGFRWARGRLHGGRAPSDEGPDGERRG